MGLDTIQLKPVEELVLNAHPRDRAIRCLNAFVSKRIMRRTCSFSDGCGGQWLCR